MAKDKLTVGDLRKALEGHPDDMEVMLEIDAVEDMADLAQANLRQAAVECRCDEADVFYLWGSIEDDNEEHAESEALVSENMENSMLGPKASR